MSESWPLPDDVVCPECGEDEHLSGEIVSEQETEDGDREVLEAELRCGGYPDPRKGCGHTWTWSAEGDA